MNTCQYILTNRQDCIKMVSVLQKGEILALQKFLCLKGFSIDSRYIDSVGEKAEEQLNGLKSCAILQLIVLTKPA